MSRQYLPLLPGNNCAAPIAIRDGRIVTVAEFGDDLHLYAARLGAEHGFLLNLCEDRYLFLVAYCAAIARGWTNLLPPSRAPQVIADVVAGYPGAIRCVDSDVRDSLLGDCPPAPRLPAIAGDHVATISFTSGSTGDPQPYPKRWLSLAQSTSRNAAAIRASIDERYGNVRPWIVATVPPQHVFGMEMSILLPVLGGMAVHCGRPMFARDVAEALAEVPSPRILVTTPVHLRALVESGVRFPETALIVSATAPLDAAIAARAEQVLDSTVLEFFGSTETCALAQRRTSIEEPWTLHEGVRLVPGEQDTAVEAPWLAQSVRLQDVVEKVSDRQFVLRGRNSDLVEVAGKRASLADLTRRLLAVPGVTDAVVIQLDPVSSGVRRIAALAVAPGLEPAEVLAALATQMDPVFLPRPLVLLKALPRNELGKLPRQGVLDAIARQSRRVDRA